MDALTAGIVNLKQATTISQVQYAVARKMLDNEQSQGAAAVKLIQAATKGASSAGDELTAAATGLGSEVDTYA